MKAGKDEVQLDLRIGKLHFFADSKQVYFKNYEEGEQVKLNELKIED